MRTSKKVYISTPLKSGKFNLDIIQKVILQDDVFAYIPPTEEKNNQQQGSQINLRMIEQCDEMWVFGPIGRDCSWEVGYAQGLKIPVIFFHTDDNDHVVKEDWMIFSLGTPIVRI